MKLSLLWLCLFGMLCCSARADLYRGTITQKITSISGDPDPAQWYQSNSAWYQAYLNGADTFVGYYEYQSSAIDGTFSYLNYGDPNNSLDGSVYLPFPVAPLYGHDGWNALSNTRNIGIMTVAAGVVTDFGWTWESGGHYAQFGTHSFMAIAYTDFWSYFPDLSWDQWHGLRVDGSITFGTPSLVSKSWEFPLPPRVDDNGSPFLLPGALLLLAACGRRLLGLRDG